MDKITFYAKKDFDYKTLGFEENDKEFVLWKKTRRITIKKQENYKMSFNMVDKSILEKIVHMAWNYLIEIAHEEKEPKICSISVTEKEYETIMKMREKYGK
jgi:hypothetical protein